MSFIKKYLKYLQKTQYGGAGEGDTIVDMRGNILGTIVIIEPADDEILYINKGVINRVLISDEDKTWKVMPTPGGGGGGGGGGGSGAAALPLPGVAVGNVISDMQDNILGTVTIIDPQNNEIIYTSLASDDIGQVLISDHNKSWKLRTAAVAPKPLPRLAPPPGLGHAPRLGYAPGLAPPPRLGHAPGLGHALPPGLVPPPGLGHPLPPPRRIINLTFPYHSAEIVGENKDTYTVKFIDNKIRVFFKNKEGVDWKFE